MQSEDLISRSDAIVQIERRLQMLIGDGRVHPESFINFLKNRPSIDISRQDIIQSMDDIEFRSEARRRGFRLVKIKPNVSIKLSPCVCGRKKIDRWWTIDNEFLYSCPNCFLRSEPDKTVDQAKLNWNNMIKEKSKNE